MRGAVIDSFHSGCGNRNGNRHRRWRCHGATLCGPADTVALRRTAEDPAGAAGLTVSSCAGCRWAAACVPAGLSPGNRRSISAAAAISPDRSKAARTLAASASSLLPWRTSAKHGRHAAAGASSGFPDALYPGPCPAHARPPACRVWPGGGGCIRPGGEPHPPPLRCPDWTGNWRNQRTAPERDTSTTHAGQ